MKNTSKEKAIEYLNKTSDKFYDEWRVKIISLSKAIDIAL